jgi:ribonuclease E
VLKEVTVRVCDTCQRVGVPTRSYTITDDEGREGNTDRCSDHAEAFEGVLAAPGDAEAAPPVEPEPAETTAAKAPAKRAPAKTAPAKKAAAKKTASKKTTARTRSRTPTMTLEEIEAAKAAGTA